MTPDEAVHRVQREREIKRIDSRGERLIQEIEVGLAAALAALDDLDVPGLSSQAALEIQRKRESAIKEAVSRSEGIRRLSQDGGKFVDRLAGELIWERELQPQYRRFLREAHRLWIVKGNRVRMAIPDEALRSECTERLQEIFLDALDQAGAILERMQ